MENENTPKEEQKEDTSKVKDFAQPCAPEFVTLQTLNEQNRKYWANQGGEGVIT